MQELLCKQGVQRIRADQCQLGQQTSDGDPVKKPTGFMSNAAELLAALNRRCFGKNGLCSRPQGGHHRECIGRVARNAAVFQEELCITILKGLRAQLISDGVMFHNEIGIMINECEVEQCGSASDCLGLRPADAPRRHVCNFSRRASC